ncbi:PPE domain-containing protein [Nocardia sp. NEAU-G5]|uniref:PPE domain-containing protein n=1 Tax=Nocardia albiluteola TaxID=2842303 RepID=A0ABS6BD16_9NOCA|nr:PPE domain-containing protein [Nocardia albiluteola]MBU3067108.1 PPE domain-containing protein [Nocardia albiluteola]
MGFGDFISSLTGLFDPSVSPTQSATNAGTQGQQDRATAQTQGATLAQNFHGDYLPEGVAAMMESFDTMSHDRIIQYRDKVVPNDMNESAGRWKTLADDTHTKATLFQGAIEGLINNGWSGASAESAKANVRKYVDDVDTLKNAAAIVATKISDAAATLTQVKAQIPDKPQNRATSVLGIVTDVVTGVTGNPTSLIGSVMADHGRRDNAQNAARDVMNNVYKKYLPESDQNVPKMPGVTTADNTSHTGASGPVGPSSSYGPSSNSNAHSYGPSTSNSPTGASGPSSPSSSTSSSTSPSSLNLPDAKTGTSSNLSGLSSSMSGTNTSTAGYSPSGVGTAGTTGTGGLNSSTGGLGSSVPGTTGTTTTTAANATTAAGKTTSGMPSGMMGGAGQKGKGEGDGEHKTPEWLKGIQEELVGPEPKLLPGGVIGGDYADS